MPARLFVLPPPVHSVICRRGGSYTLAAPSVRLLRQLLPMMEPTIALVGVVNEWYLFGRRPFIWRRTRAVADTHTHTYTQARTRTVTRLDVHTHRERERERDSERDRRCDVAGRQRRLFVIQ